MQDDVSKNRLIVTMALVLLVMTGWNVLFPKRRPTPPQAGAVSTASAAVDAGVAPEIAAAVPTSTAAVTPTPTIVGEAFPFSGRVEFGDMKVPYELSISNVGGGIQTYILPTYKERNQDNEATEDPITLANPTSFTVEDAAGAQNQMAGLRFLEETTFKVPARIPFEVVEKTEDTLHLRYTSPEGGGDRA